MSVSENTQKYFGKYRGNVINNVDPLFRGRLLVQVPDVLGVAPSSWAEPCVPLAGPTGPPMGVYLVPPIGAGVWVEFEQGDPEYPIWVGCRWGGPSDIPPLARAGLPISPSIIMQTAGQNTLAISDLPGPAGGITLCAGPIASPTSPRIMITQTAIIITTGTATITMAGPTVTINNGALVIV